MRVEDKLSSEQKQTLKATIKQNKPPSKKKKHKRKPEHVDWIDIMGMNRDTYKRHNGAIRRK